MCMIKKEGFIKTRSTSAKIVTVKQAITAFPLVLDADVGFAHIL